MRFLLLAEIRGMSEIGGGVSQETDAVGLKQTLWSTENPRA